MKREPATDSLFLMKMSRKMTKNRGAGIFRSGTKNSGEFFLRKASKLERRVLEWRAGYCSLK
jgi:hypothetical protein